MAMAYVATDPVPALGLVFQNVDVATAIFAGWRRAIGATDADDLIRIALIEGDLAGTSPGYMVHVGIDPQVVASRAGASNSAAGCDAPAEVWRRMPNPGDPNLRRFKESYARNGRYVLAPAAFGGQRIDLLMHVAVGKRRLALRRVSDVGMVGDPDAGLWER